MNSTNENTIVILDDDPTSLLLLKGLFKNEPYHIITTSEPSRVLEVLQKEKNVKVVMSDQVMPSITGVDFFKKVKSLYPDIVRVLFTAWGEVKIAETAINEGEVYRFIIKPWNVEDLKCALKQAVDHFDLNRQNKNYLQATIEKSKELEQLSKKYMLLYERQKNFTSTISHELRTPLATIKLATDLLLSESPGKITEDQVNFLNKVKQNSDRLNLLVSDILDLTELESGEMVLKFSPHQADLIIDDIVTKQRPSADKKGLTLTMELCKDIPTISFDEERIRQVLNNLIDNAIKFTESGSVTVSCTKQEKNLTFCVQDTGPGIAQENQEKIFDKFQQLGDSLTNASGTGLGLALCKEIVEQHQGTIRIDSDVGKGCRFYFTLPLQDRVEPRS